MTTKTTSRMMAATAWAPDSNTYAILENKVKRTVYKNSEERGGAGKKGGELEYGWGA
jgi:coatomer subunit beta'